MLQNPFAKGAGADRGHRPGLCRPAAGGRVRPEQFEVVGFDINAERIAELKAGR